jgi:hypothetical protein
VGGLAKPKAEALGYLEARTTTGATATTTAKTKRTATAIADPLGDDDQKKQLQPRGATAKKRSNCNGN